MKATVQTMLQPFIDGMLEAVWMVDPIELRVVAANAAAHTLMGLEAGSLVGRPAIELAATPDVARMEQAIAALCPQDAPAFRRFMTDNRDKLARFERCLETPFLGWRDLLRPYLLKLLPLLRPWNSLDRELGRYFSDPRLRLAFSFQSKTYQVRRTSFSRLQRAARLASSALPTPLPRSRSSTNKSSRKMPWRAVKVE